MSIKQRTKRKAKRLTRYIADDCYPYFVTVMVWSKAK